MFSPHNPRIFLIEDFFEWLFADKRKRKILKYVPKYCRICEVVGICRDENNNWKCRNGCYLMNSEKIKK